MNEYQYPDPNDILCADSIAGESSSSQYWEESEALVLDRCFSLAFSSKKSKTKTADIGCGDGRLLRLLSKHSGVVLGVEPSRDRLENAAKSASRLSNVVVINGTAANLPSESFDVVFCSHVIQHLSFDEQKKLSENIVRILKPNGIVIITTTFTAREQSEFVFEYWQDGKRVQEATDAAGFNDAYGNDSILSTQKFSRMDLLNYFDDCKVIDFGCFHFSGLDDAGQDAALNCMGNLSNAMDAFYVLKKEKQRAYWPKTIEHGIDFLKKLVSQRDR